MLFDITYLIYYKIRYIIELVFQNKKIVAAKDYDILQNPKA